MTAYRAALLMLLFMPGAALAQSVASFDRLADQVNAGDTVRVVDTAGREHAGRVAALGADALSLARDRGATERLARAEVREVWLRRRDPVRNGALIGFTAAWGSYCGFGLSWERPGLCGIPAIFFGGLGAGLGVLVDAAITRDGLIFRASPVTWRVQPTRGGIAGGVAVQW